MMHMERYSQGNTLVICCAFHIKQKAIICVMAVSLVNKPKVTAFTGTQANTCETCPRLCAKILLVPANAAPFCTVN